MTPSAKGRDRASRTADEGRPGVMLPVTEKGVDRSSSPRHWRMSTGALLLAACLIGSLTYMEGMAQSQTPSLELEGTGSLVPNGECTKSQCFGIFSAAVSGPPVGGTSVSLNLRLSLNPRQTTAVAGCYATVGSGSLGDSYTAGVVGELCLAYDHFTLSANIEIGTANPCAAPWQAMSGELTAFGRIHTIGPTPAPPKSRPNHPANPIWPVSEAVVGIVGTASELPAPCPAP